MILKDCLEKIIDNRGRNPKYYDNEAYPVIDNVMIKNNYHPNINEATRFIDQDTHDNFLRGYLEPNIPIMTLVGGGIGNVSLSIDEKSVIVQNTIGFKTKPEVLDSIYLYYWFLYKHDELIQFNRGSGQPSIRKTDIENMNIELKDINYQKKVSKILSKIDEKIELNNKINNNLHELVKNEYYERFIVNKRDDWKEDTLGNYLSIDRGLSYKGQFLSDNGVPMINLGNVMPNGVFRIEKNKYYSGDFKKKVTTKVGDIVLANTDMTQNREVIGTPVIVPPIYDGKIIFSHHIYCLRDLKLPKMFIFYTLLTDDWNAAAGGNATGTTVLALPKNTIENYTITIPDNESLAIFDNIATSIQEKRELIMLENIKLEELIDTLLPKLMNGEIDLDNIEI